MKSNGKVVLSSVVAAAISAVTVVGGTLALFTSEHRASISMTAATVDVSAAIDTESLKLYTRDVEQTGTFQDGGTADFVDGDLVLSNIVPGDKVTFNIDVTNNSTVNVMYRVTWDMSGELMEALNITAGTASPENEEWKEWLVTTDVKEYTINMMVELPLGVNNDYQAKEASLSFTFEAVQASGYDLYASNAQEIRENLTNGEDVVFVDDVTTVDTLGTSYGKSGLNQDGQTIDGAGHTLTVNGANSTWDCGVYTKGGTIQNLTVNGAFRGIFTGGISSDLVLDNVIVDKVCYTFNADGKTVSAYKLIATNSTFNGWTSYSNIFSGVSFTNCQFGKGTGSYEYAYCRPYCATTFTNCVFAEGYEFDSTETTSTFVNCYVGDTLITAENVVALLGADAANIVFANK